MIRQQCRTCLHPKRTEIDRELVTGNSITNVANKYNVPYNSVYGHYMNGHISRQLSQVYLAREMQNGSDMLDRIAEIVSKAETIFTRNFEAGRDLTALKALAEQRQTFQLLAQIVAHAEKLRSESLEATREEEERRNQQLLQRRLSILTTEELLFLHRIEKKLESGVKADVIIPDIQKQTISDNFRTFRRTRFPEPRPEGENQQEPSENDAEGADMGSDNFFRVEIPVTPWKHNPLNPRYEPPKI